LDKNVESIQKNAKFCNCFGQLLEVNAADIKSTLIAYRLLQN